VQVVGDIPQLDQVSCHHDVICSLCGVGDVCDLVVGIYLKSRFFYYFYTAYVLYYCEPGGVDLMGLKPNS